MTSELTESLLHPEGRRLPGSSGLVCRSGMPWGQEGAPRTPGGEAGPSWWGALGSEQPKPRREALWLSQAASQLKFGDHWGGAQAVNSSDQSSPGPPFPSTQGPSAPASWPSFPGAPPPALPPSSCPASPPQGTCPPALGSLCVCRDLGTRDHSIGKAGCRQPEPSGALQRARGD